MFDSESDHSGNFPEELVEVSSLDEYMFEYHSWLIGLESSVTWDPSDGVFGSCSTYLAALLRLPHLKCLIGERIARAACKMHRLQVQSSQATLALQSIRKNKLARETLSAPNHPHAGSMHPVALTCIPKNDVNDVR